MLSDQNNAPNSATPGQESNPLNLDNLQDPSTLENLVFGKHPTALNNWEEDYVSEALQQQRVNGDNPLVGKKSNDLLEGSTSEDLIAGGLGDDVIFGFGGNDVLRGDRNSRSPGGAQGGNDLIFGGDGNDRIGGKGGNDILLGGSGDDHIWGDAGDDIIRGGLGNDRLVGDNFSGDRGNDIFVLANGEGTDTILDFRNGEDLIGLADGLTFEQLNIAQGTGNEAGNTLIENRETGERLAILNDVDSSTIGSDDFTTSISGDPDPNPDPGPDPDPDPEPDPNPDPEPDPNPDPGPDPDPDSGPDPDPDPGPDPDPDPGPDPDPDPEPDPDPDPEPDPDPDPEPDPDPDPEPDPDPDPEPDPDPDPEPDPDPDPGPDPDPDPEPDPDPDPEPDPNPDPEPDPDPDPEPDPDPDPEPDPDPDPEPDPNPDPEPDPDPDPEPDPDPDPEPDPDPDPEPDPDPDPEPDPDPDPEPDPDPDPEPDPDPDPEPDPDPDPEPDPDPDPEPDPDPDPEPDPDPDPEPDPDPDPEPDPDPDPDPEPDPNPDPEPDPNPSEPAVAVGDPGGVPKFTPNVSEAELIAMNAPSITIGTQTIYVGQQQVSSNNQNPIIASFDSSDPSNNWVRTDYETTAPDGRAYGLYWDGNDLYAAFSIVGTGGSPSQDFRRVSSDAETAWLRSYGRGGGPRVSVVGKIDPATGELLDAAYITAELTSGNSNSLNITNFSTNSQGNLVITANTASHPRRSNGEPVLIGGVRGYQVELTSDLNRVVSTSVDNE